jgi:hypothetical protein
MPGSQIFVRLRVFECRHRGFGIPGQSDVHFFDPVVDVAAGVGQSKATLIDRIMLT